MIGKQTNLQVFGSMTRIEEILSEPTTCIYINFRVTCHFIRALIGLKS